LSRKILLIAAFAASLSAADIQAPPWEKSRVYIGRDLYRENCVVCHDIDKDQKHTRKLGPSLNHLFTNAKLPLSHGKPNRAYVVVRIKFGGALMPAFNKRLSDSEISTLVDYIGSK
jgi:mono/diheme cytochrome c family protein